MLKIRRRSFTVTMGIAILAALFIASVGGAAASTIVQPSGSPVTAAVPPTGQLAPVAVVAAGFAPGALVYVEQCDGVPPSEQQWTPTAHCDLGSSPAPAIADAGGKATFAAADANHAFRPFAGESPQSLFNCTAPGRKVPANGLPSFANCKLRVSTNNASVTVDQVFRVLAFRAAAVSSTTSPSSAVANGAHSSTTNAKRAATASPARSPKPTSAKTKGAAPARSSAVAVVAAPAHDDVGLLSLSDPNHSVGYVLVLVGVLLVGVVVALRRHDSRLAIADEAR
jgi:hypothetical protein